MFASTCGFGSETGRGVEGLQVNAGCGLTGEVCFEADRETSARTLRQIPQDEYGFSAGAAVKVRVS